MSLMSENRQISHEPTVSSPYLLSFVIFAIPYIQ